MRSFITSLGLFTTIPVPPTHEFDRRTAARAMAAMPWVGLLLGVLAGGLTAGAWWLSGSVALAGVCGFGLLAWLTGGLHLDGVADTADGLGSRKPAAEALAIMKRSDIGPMGVIALVLVLLVDIAALTALAAADWRWLPLALMVGAMSGRLAVVQATTTPDAARPGGFGAMFSGVTGTWSAWLNSLLVAAVCALGGWLIGGWGGLLVVIASRVISQLFGGWWTGHLRRRLGGLTGDTFGSIIELVQTVTLLVLALLVSRWG